ncbi:unnamed protein product [Arctia plantaginis]|uniref:Uncharacterized protein n=1 Tax=Arctia plantaginis TaxID=874455 RepID=A0A8S1A198_ARCPL|nr:unnamed protein product [Arctia plantaginis]
MGRKIPAKKHRGVKDPLLQQAKRLESLKGKINAPPKDPDEQPMPRSIIRLFGLPDPSKKNTAKNSAHRKTRPLPNKKDEGVSCTGDNPISRLHKLPGESGRGFSLRINSAIKALHGADEDLEYPHDLEAEDYKGQRMAEQRERRAKKRRRAEKAAKKAGGEGENTEGHLTRIQKLALKKKAKKMKALEAGEEQAEVVYERVAFGEVTHAPPALHFKASAGAPRPGRRELLLSGMLRGQGGAGRGAGGVGGAGGADAARRERARLDAVAAYRALKARKRKNK